MLFDIRNAHFSTANHKFITVTSQTVFTTFERETFVLITGNIDGIVLLKNNSCKARFLMQLVSSPLNKQWLPDPQLLDFLAVLGVFPSFPLLIKTEQ